MSDAIDRIKAEASHLSTAEKADLAYFLLGSLDSGSDTDPDAAWEAELTRRLHEIESGGAPGIPAETVLDSLRRKYS